MRIQKRKYYKNEKKQLRSTVATLVAADLRLFYSFYFRSIAKEPIAAFIESKVEVGSPGYRPINFELSQFKAKLATTINLNITKLYIISYNITAIFLHTFSFVRIVT